MYESKPPLLPVCAFCKWQEECIKTGQLRSPGGECFEAVRLPTVERMRDLSRWWRGTTQEPGSPALEVVDRLLQRYGKDRQEYSEIFEPSVSLDERGWRFFRFSYGFPGFRREPAAIRDFISSLWEPYGAELCKWVKGLLWYSTDPCVEQLIVGLDDEGPGRWRAKLYFQFADDSGDAPWELATRISRNSKIEGLERWDGLHLLGLDLVSEGICGIKWYVKKKVADLSDPTAPWNHSELLSVLRQRGVESLRNLLVIFREGARDDPQLLVPREVDFLLPENQISLEALSSSETFRPLLQPGTPLQEMVSAFRIAPRRLSVPLGDEGKINLYYLLIE